MNVLTRDEIIAIFNTGTLRIETPDNFYQTESGKAISRDNPFQSCSVDLHIGSIYVPETGNNELDSMLSPRTDEYILETGGTALIRTNEK